MSRTIYIYAIFLVMVVGLTEVEAQDKLTYRDASVTLSPSGQRYEQFDFNTESRMLSNYLTNPAYERVLALDSTVVTRSYIAVSGAAANLSGDYLISEGNNFRNYSIDGFGVTTLKRHGTLYGHVQFSQGEDKSIGWNSIRYSDIYSPYITTDSIGGDTSYDFYSLKGGYAFNRGNWFYGVEVSFKGEQAHRMTDPRLLNITSWVNAKVGVGYHTSRSTTLLSASYERNKQYQTMRYWRPGQQERMFVTNGFGLYDTAYSLVVMGYSRMYYMGRMEFNLSHEYNFDNNSSLSLGVGYDRYRVSTEETSVRNLYNANTTLYTPKFEFKTKWAALDLSIYGEYNYHKRQGEENIYETYLSDEVNYVYDFRLISTRYNYSAVNSNFLLQIKPTLKVTPLSAISLVAGAYGANREEAYVIGDYYVQNQWVEPHIGVGFDLNSRKNQISASFIYSQKLTLKGIYDVDIPESSIDYLDFQHAFAPYAFYANEYYGLKLSVSYIRHLKPISIGFKFEGMIRDGERNSDAIYTKEIGFESVAPLISKTPDLYNEKWGQFSTFVIF